MYRPLLDYLAAAEPAYDSFFGEWHISPIRGGTNNRLYRARSLHGDFAVKFTLRDDRDRAAREFNTLRLLRAQGLVMAPQAVLLERDVYRQPVVVQTWVDGVQRGVPADDAAWRTLLELYAHLHSLTPERVEAGLPEAILTASSAAQAVQRVREQAQRLPAGVLSAEAADLIGRLDGQAFPVWDVPPRALLRTDPNPDNFIRRDERLYAVDWENSGWGDPAFEIADLLSHAGYMDVPADRKDWIAAAYASMVGQPDVVTRVNTYHTVLLVWWVVRFERYLYEIPRQLDNRLVERPANWRQEALRKRAYYIEQAHMALK